MVFAQNLSAPEGPVLLPDQSWLIVEMGPSKGCITHISADGKSRRIIGKIGRPNGLAVDKDGTIWVAESVNPPSLVKVTMGGDLEVMLTRCDGTSFLFPNDLAFGPDGALYLTDSGILFNQLVTPGGVIRHDFMDIPMDGRIYRIDVKTKHVETIDSGFRFTNGLAFGPDKNLYVAETLTGMIYRYRCADGKVVGRREAFGQIIDRGKGSRAFHGPDGMAFGLNGCLYVAVYGQGNITVLGPDGTVVGRIATKGAKPTNVAFGAPGERKIYVTEDEYGVIEAIDVDTDGLPLYR
ncbi:MAG: SMP-30/gluconolactonase/LRE family protein [Deltaproteobacteria bacterium]|nr:SMP-30/gluconolactonase/LRE family protein [Deltaproteobacteria bacterium]